MNIYDATKELNQIFLSSFRLMVDGHYLDGSKGLTDDVYELCVNAFHKIAKNIEKLFPGLREFNEDDELWYDGLMDDILPKFYDIVYNRE